VQLLHMAWSIVVFIVLLAWFRAVRLLGAHAGSAASLSTGQPVSATASLFDKK
jgi:hypothetical protein